MAETANEKKKLERQSQRLAAKKKAHEFMGDSNSEDGQDIVMVDEDEDEDENRGKKRKSAARSRISNKKVKDDQDLDDEIINKFREAGIPDADIEVMSHNEKVQLTILLNSSPTQSQDQDIQPLTWLPNDLLDVASRSQSPDIFDSQPMRTSPLQTDDTSGRDKPRAQDYDPEYDFTTGASPTKRRVINLKRRVANRNTATATGHKSRPIREDLSDTESDSSPPIKRQNLSSNQNSQSSQDNQSPVRRPVFTFECKDDADWPRSPSSPKLSQDKRCKKWLDLSPFHTPDGYCPREYVTELQLQADSILHLLHQYQCTNLPKRQKGVAIETGKVHSGSLDPIRTGRRRHLMLLEEEYYDWRAVDGVRVQQSTSPPPGQPVHTFLCDKHGQHSIALSCTLDDSLHSGNSNQSVDGIPHSLDGNPHSVDGNPHSVDGNPHSVDGNPQCIDEELPELNIETEKCPVFINRPGDLLDFPGYSSNGRQLPAETEDTKETLPPLDSDFDDDFQKSSGDLQTGCYGNQKPSYQGNDRGDVKQAYQSKIAAFSGALSYGLGVVKDEVQKMTRAVVGGKVDQLTDTDKQVRKPAPKRGKRKLATKQQLSNLQFINHPSPVVQIDGDVIDDSTNKSGKKKLQGNLGGLVRKARTRTTAPSAALGRSNDHLSVEYMDDMGKICAGYLQTAPNNGAVTDAGPLTVEEITKLIDVRKGVDMENRGEVISLALLDEQLVRAKQKNNDPDIPKGAVNVAVVEALTTTPQTQCPLCSDYFPEDDVQLHCSECDGTSKADLFKAQHELTPPESNETVAMSNQPIRARAAAAVTARLQQSSLTNRVSGRYESLTNPGSGRRVVMLDPEWQNRRTQTTKILRNKKIVDCEKCDVCDKTFTRDRLAVHSVKCMQDLEQVHEHAANTITQCEHCSLHIPIPDYIQHELKCRQLALIAFRKRTILADMEGGHLADDTVTNPPIVLPDINDDDDDDDDTQPPERVDIISDDELN